MVTLYRGMKEGLEGGPECGSTARTLGVRVPGDVEPDTEGRVLPRTGGMSVAPDDPMRLRPHRRPRALGGTGPDPVFSIRVELLGGSLTARADREGHALVEPSVPVEVAFDVRALHQTRSSWRKLA